MLRVKEESVCAFLTAMVSHTVSCPVWRGGPAPLSTPEGSLWEGGAARGLGPAYLQAVTNPPVEDGEVGVQGQQHSCEGHLLVDANDRNHFEVECLQGGCRGQKKVRG